MKPSLPTALFDLCLIPAHDNLMFQPRNIVRTEGSLNRIQPSIKRDSRQGIFLVGGPSRHFVWSDENVLRQILSVTQKEQMHWTLATSERTPGSFVRVWRTQVPGIPLMTSQECSSQWLPEQLAKCGTAWVTCDSMSMIYEALTAGTRVGLLELPRLNNDRISRNIRRLIAAGLTVTTSQWLAGRKLPVQIRPFSESNRCAAIIAERLLQPMLSDPLFRPSTDRLKRSSVAADFRSPPGELNSLLASESVRSQQRPANSGFSLREFGR